MKLKTHYAFSFSSLLLVLLATLSGCKKTEIAVKPDYDILRVYNDSSATGQSPIMWMDAGKENIFMTYGTSSFGQHINGNFDPQNMKSRVMATDKEGHFLWRRDLPTAMDQAVVMAMDDGGCLVAAKFSWGGVNPAISGDNVYFYRYDHNGNLTKTDSVNLMTNLTLPYNFVSLLNAYHGHDGSVIIMGDCGGMGFYFQYSPDNGLEWIKSYDNNYGIQSFANYLDGCVPTDDGGYFLTGGFLDLSNFVSLFHPLVIKINAAGDTLWTKRFTGYDYGWWDRNVVKLTNGNYCFAFNATYLYTSEAVIYQFNEQGDSVCSTIINNEPNNVLSMLVPTDNGGCFALVNESPTNAINAVPGTIFQQANTRKLFFDDHLNKISDTYFQQLTTDYLVVTCKTADNRIACFGMLQQMDRSVYLPHLYILK